MKNFRLKKIEKVFLRLQNIKISEFSTYYFEKLNFFLSKNHLAFCTIKRYDIELSKFQMKILCLWVVDRPLKVNHFYRYFEILLILARNTESLKHSQVQNFIVYGNRHHSITRKIGFRVIS